MSSLAQLKVLWQGWSSRFAALQGREKQLIIGALVVAILFGGFTLFVEPGITQSERLKKTLAQQQLELEQFQTQIATLAAQSSDPDSANREALQRVREQLAVMEGDLRAFDRILVAPRQAPALLQTLLARHRGLSLVSLTTLSPQPLIDPPVATAGKAVNDGAKHAAEANMPGVNIYKHGIEIKLAGGYGDLLAYVADLEASPQKLLWGGMRLTVKQFPVSELTLTVYTLSLDSIWLVV
jgi:MSHA biogenesis protein MshJ